MIEFPVAKMGALMPLKKGQKTRFQYMQILHNAKKTPLESWNL